MSTIDQSELASHAEAHSAQSPWLKLLREAVAVVDFGTVQIKIHDGEVVQIETTRKIRVPSRKDANL